jgi:hypothetical protein
MLHIPGYKGNTKQNHLRFHLTPVRMAIIKSTNNNKYWQGCVGKRNHHTHGWEYKLVQPLWKTVWRLLKNKIALPYDQATPQRYF